MTPLTQRHTKFLVHSGVHSIIICEDHDVVVDGVRLMLASQHEFQLVGHARTLADVEMLVQAHNPQILLLDLNLQGDDGFAVLEKLKSSHPTIRVIIVTMYEEAFLVEKAKRLGADGYLLKNMSNGELLNAINQVVLTGKFYLQASLEKTHRENAQYRDGFIEKMHLTPREVEIIKLIVKGKQAKEIADELFLSMHTVDTHRRNVLTKLNLKNIADLTRFAIENKLT